MLEAEAKALWPRGINITGMYIGNISSEVEVSAACCTYGSEQDEQTETSNL